MQKGYFSWKWRHQLSHSGIQNTFFYINLYLTQRVFSPRCHIREPNAIHYQMAPDINYNENICLNFFLQNWLRYRYSKFQFCLLPSAIRFWFRVTQIGALKDTIVNYVSWKFEHNRRSTYRDTAFWSGLGGVVCTPQRGVWTHCYLSFRVFTKIFLTAKRSYSRTPRLYRTTHCTIWNLLQVV